jgi:hypothetical protein
MSHKADAPPVRPTLNPIDPETLKPVSIAVALRSTQRLAVLGQPGAGRTILLSRLARVHINKQAEEELGTVGRLPIFLHLAEADWAKASDKDPVGVLLPVATAHVPNLIAPNVGNLMQGRIRSGSAILLLDGLDEVTPTHHARIVQWLAALLTKYPTIQVVVTTGLFGYGALQNLGFAALKLSDWTYREVDRATENWIAVLVAAGKIARSSRKGCGRCPTSPPTRSILRWRSWTGAPAHVFPPAASRYTITGWNAPYGRMGTPKT